MTRRVVCVSRTLGARGEDVAQRAAAALTYRYLDDEILAVAAEKAGVSLNQIAKAEHSQPLVSRIMESLATAPMISEGGYITPPVADPTFTYSTIIEHVIRESADAGDVVIVAHGASHPLSSREDVLRVLVTASPETRIARIADADSIDAAAARKAIETSDRERARYLDRFYKIAHETPTQYDLTINTDALAPEAAAALIVAAARG